MYKKPSEHVVVFQVKVIYMYNVYTLYVHLISLTLAK